jgi:hypothetical protein
MHALALHEDAAESPRRGGIVDFMLLNQDIGFGRK